MARSLKAPTPQSAATRPWTPCSFLLFKDKTQYTHPEKTNRGQKCISEQQFSNLFLLQNVSQYTDAGEGGVHTAGSPLPRRPGLTQALRPPCGGDKSSYLLGTYHGLGTCSELDPPHRREPSPQLEDEGPEARRGSSLPQT